MQERMKIKRNEPQKNGLHYLFAKWEPFSEKKEKQAEVVLDLAVFAPNDFYLFDRFCF